MLVWLGGWEEMLGQINIDAILRDYGPKGLLVILALGAMYGIGKGITAAFRMIQTRIEASDKALAEVVLDARQERDAARAQREREANAFLQSLRDQSLEMRRGFDEVLRELREGDGNQKTGRRK